MKAMIRGLSILGRCEKAKKFFSVVLHMLEQAQQEFASERSFEHVKAIKDLLYRYGYKLQISKQRGHTAAKLYEDIHTKTND